jgi:hypothetical protein
LWGTEAKAGSDEEQEEDASFGSAYDWAKNNHDKALGSIWDYWFHGGPAIIKPVQAKFPSADEMARRLNTTRDDWHRKIKEEIKSDLIPKFKELGKRRNFDVGIDSKGNIVLRNKLTGKEISTNVPLKNYAK